MRLAPIITVRSPHPHSFAARLLTTRLLLVGLLVMAAVTVVQAADQLPKNFITRRGDQLFDGAAECRFVSVDLPDVLQIITHYSFDGTGPDARFRLPNEYELRDAVATVHQLGANVARGFVITCRPQPHPMFMFAVGGDQAVANEPALQVFDRLLQICNEQGVRLIIPLVAYNSPAIRGDYSTYGKDFWVVGSPANLRFKSMLATLLPRKNTFTGVRYCDDPAIFGWQTGNELVMGDDPERHRWLHDIAAFIKRIDSHHILIDGRNRPTDVYGKYDEFFADLNIDAVSYHTYGHLPEANTAVGTLQRMRAMTRGRIPLLVTEIAMTTPPDTLRAILDEVIADGTTGAAFWAVRYHNRDGGFYKHSDRDSQFEDLNWPGFADSAFRLPEIDRERELLTILATYAAKIRGRAPAGPRIPASPTLLPIPDPGHISWQGSTGAEFYELQRATEASGPWTIVAPRLQDHLVVCAPLFCDMTAAPNQNYYYRIIAHTSAGASSPSAPVGPVVADRTWLVDELFDLHLTADGTRNIHINASYAHSAFLEDIAVAERAVPGESATLVYRVPGALRSASVEIYGVGATSRLLAGRGNSARHELSPRVERFDGRRTRLTAEFDRDDDTVEIQLLSSAPPGQAVGRVEVSYQK